MIDRESLEMIAQIMDQKLEENNAKLEARLEASMDAKLYNLESRMDAKLDSLEARMDSKLDTMEARLKLSISELGERVTHVEDDIHRIKQTLELNIEPKLQLLAENFLPAVIRMNDATAKIDRMQAQINILNLTVADHSQKLQCIG